MTLIRDHLQTWDDNLPRVCLRVDRLTLAKRRWRGIAEDGEEFGFDLEHPLEHGDAFFQAGLRFYSIEQKPEAVVEVSLSESNAEAARIGWLFGNLHFAIQITDEAVRIADDPAVIQVCEREGLSYTLSEQLFTPLGSSHSHGHEH